MFQIKLTVINTETGVDVDTQSSELSEEQVLAWTETALKASVFSIRGSVPIKYYYINSKLSKSTSYPNKIAFIKALRTITGCGLRDAKDIVESDATIMKCKAYHFDAILEYLKQNAHGYDFLKSTFCSPSSMKQDRKGYKTNSYSNDDILVPEMHFISKLGLQE